MMTTCPICGTRRVIYWPELWVYRRGETYYCSEDCMIVDQTKDMKLIKMIAHVRAKKGENSMARYKKDGTPARKPGPKKKIETPEKITIKADDVVGKIANAETPERPAKKPIEYKVTGIQTEVGEFWVVREGKIKWVPGRLAKEDPVMQVMWPEAEPALVPEMWRRFAEIILDVLDLLEVES